VKRLISFETNSGRLGFGLIQGDQVIDFSEQGRWPDLGAYLAGGEDAAPWDGSVGELIKYPQVELSEVRIRAPIPNPPKVVAVGLNYREHALEQDKEPPAAPMFFSKARTAVIGPGETIVLPPGREKIDVEVELVAVIGKPARNLTPERALECVVGFTVGNDVSDRQAQVDDKQFYRAKSFDTFAPLGPYVVPRQDFDHREGYVRLWRSGFHQQDGNLSQLIHKVEKLISLLSQCHRLEPGDLLFTGTPSGVGAHRNPPVFLKNGDTIVCEVEGLGRLENPVRRD
jgi:2-keto-4-pentenoate hydratase/2-oxohepta-3-ene-1,7-dioic acid hydratase in catechol pathway